MCRWFAYISPSEPCLLEDVLISPNHALTRQVYEHFLPELIPHNPKNIQDGDHLIKARNTLFNLDGLGVVWYTSSQSDFELGETGQSCDGVQKEGLRPASYKTIQPPLRDLNFKSICRNTETRVCFAHIRAASGTPIVQVNNHPFIFGRHTFMHNGVVSDFSLIKRAMCDKMSHLTYNEILGGTDSEHMAALYMTYLTNSDEDPLCLEKGYTVEEMALAMNKMVATTIQLQKTIVGAKARPNSLNLCATDGVRLIAYRFRNHAEEQPPSLYWSTTAGTTLNRKFRDNPNDIDVPNRFSGRSEDEHGKHLIVASEPSTYKGEDWHLIGRNQVLMSEPGSKHKIQDVPYIDEWNVEDPDE